MMMGSRGIIIRSRLEHSDCGPAHTDCLNLIWVTALEVGSLTWTTASLLDECESWGWAFFDAKTSFLQRASLALCWSPSLGRLGINDSYVVASKKPLLLWGQKWRHRVTGVCWQDAPKWAFAHLELPSRNSYPQTSYVSISSKGSVTLLCEVRGAYQLEISVRQGGYLAKGVYLPKPKTLNRKTLIKPNLPWTVKFS